MFVSDWMTTRVCTVSPDDGIPDAARLAKEKGIKHLPVVKAGRLKGIISDRDIKEYVPSKATSLDVYELHYLLAKTKVRAIMKRRVVIRTRGKGNFRVLKAELEGSFRGVRIIKG